MFCRLEDIFSGDKPLLFSRTSEHYNNMSGTPLPVHKVPGAVSHSHIGNSRAGILLWGDG